MSKLTEFLKLFEYEPETDGVLTFNITAALNNNWDKIDAWAKTLLHSFTAEIQIPVSAWQAMEDGGYRAAVTIEGVTADHYPIVTVHRASRAAAKGAGLDPAAETTDDGTLSFVAEAVPDDAIHASVALVAPGNTDTPPDTGGSSYTLLPATKSRLGGVKIGDGVDVTPDGTLSVDTESVLDNILATPEEMTTMLDEVFGTEEV